MNNPFDIKDTPFFYAMFESISNVTPIKTITPVFLLGNNVPTVAKNNEFYIGNYAASNINEGTDLKVDFFDSAAAQLFHISANESLGLNFTHLSYIEYIGFNYVTLTNVSYQRFVGYKLTW